MLKYIVSESPKKQILYVSSNNEKIEHMLSYFINHEENAFILETTESINEVSKKYKINQFTIIEN